VRVSFDRINTLLYSQTEILHGRADQAAAQGISHFVVAEVTDC
jgi:hypothetical protein